MAIWVGNSSSKLVHMEDCEYAMRVCFGRVEYEELYHALADGYQEAQCCLTDKPYAVLRQVNDAIRTRRRARIGALGCRICGETRCVQLAHAVPKSIGGAVCIPLCPTCHKCYDEGELDQAELQTLADYAALHISQRTGGAVFAMHGMVKRLRRGA